MAVKFTSVKLGHTQFMSTAVHMTRIFVGVQFPLAVFSTYLMSKQTSSKFNCCCTPSMLYYTWLF